MSKTIRTVVVSILLVASLALAFGAGCSVAVRTPLSAGQGMDTVAQAWDFIFRDYVDKDKLDAGALSQAAIKGMVEALDDPYTSYMDAETYRLSMSSLEGKFEGIGAHVAVRDEQIIIIAPIDGSPAHKAGIRAGDKVLGINGVSTSGVSLAEAVLKIRGPQGTSVKLLILHEGETEPVELEIVRAEIELPSVNFEMKGDIAYIRLSNFSVRTDEELSLALSDMKDEAATGIVLDLRSNPGGLLEATVNVASHFLEEGVVVSVVDSLGGQTALNVRPPAGEVVDLPMVVLVDGYSASGSEVLAGALQDYKRALIAGSKTYGKGSVNVLRQLGDGSALYITTARWITPQGRLIEGKGLSPDHELELEGEEAIQWAIDYLKGGG